MEVHPHCSRKGISHRYKQTEIHQKLKCLKINGMGDLLQLKGTAPLIPENISKQIIDGTISNDELQNIYIYSQMAMDDAEIKELSNQLENVDNESTRQYILEDFYQRALQNIDREEILNQIYMNKENNKDITPLKVQERIWRIQHQE